MSKSVLIKIFYTSAVLLMMACREKYILPDSGPARGYLVVEGFINSGNGPTNIRLSRAVGLVDTINHNYEQFASVRVEGSDNSQYTLTEAGPGLYSNTNLNLDASKQYRLHIITADGNEYLSDFEQALNTPEIDTITWERQDGVEIFANTHDPSGNTRYYRWEYEETWQFHSAFFSSIKYLLNGNGNIVGVTDRDYAESLKLYTCWKSQNSKSILIGSSVNFSKDSIHLPLVRIPEADWRLSVLYSTLVKQTAVSSKEYDFLRRMKKNTEQVGSLFDAQPSELKGNIHNVNDPAEIVIGFVGAANVKEKRIFIKNADLPGWNYRQSCFETRVRNHPDSLSLSFMPLYGEEYVNNIPLYIKVTSDYCGDCSLRGVTTKPSFWP